MTESITQPVLDNRDIVGAEDPLTRREALTKGASAASTVLAAAALGTIPFALGAFARTAQAQVTGPATVRDVLEFAYLLENLESEFYKAVLGTSATAAQNTAFSAVRSQVQAVPELLGTIQQIAKHEAAHVDFLKAQIIALGGAPVTYTGAEFDFTGANGGATPGPFYAARFELATLLALAQILEDTGVRAYKGQLDKLIGNPAVLTAALKIHSVEGRHAARIRLLRNVTNLKPWITSTATTTTTGITATGALTPAAASLYTLPTGYGRTTGAFAAEGFAVGQRVTAAGFTNAANNGDAVITGVFAAPTTDVPTTNPAGFATVQLAATATGYSRSTGSFITDGFVVGQQVVASGFTNAANNGRSTVTAVTATALTVSKATPTVVEASALGRTILGDARITVTPARVSEVAGANRFLAAQTGMTSAGTALVTRAYIRETNSLQRGVDVSGLGSNTGGVSGVNEAFDEPLTYDDVVFIIKDFVIGTTP